MKNDIYSYITLNEARNKQYTSYSVRQLKRIINENLNNNKDLRVIYAKSRYGKTIKIDSNYIIEIEKTRKRKPKNKIKSELTPNNNICFQTEITVNIRNEMNRTYVQDLINHYNTNFPVISSIEGTGNDLHFHLMVCDQTVEAKQKITQLLKYFCIDLVNANILIRPIWSIPKFQGYISKFINPEYRNLKPENRNEYLNYFGIIAKSVYFSPFGKDVFDINIFKYKCVS